ncbi:MAG: hypothetical protein SFY56_01935 [Bacteroidota bacterium]|nr:hypothetical protein [Bacteroidota bacterium]
MKATNTLLNKDWKIVIALFICTFLYYFIYLKEVFLNANSILSTVGGDSTKNYFTFIYHIVNDKSALNFSGLNYPFGEHLVYTDCQPLLTFILRLLPFTQNYLIGILHLLILFSYVVTPCIYFKIFRLFHVNALIAFLSGLAIVILSPQLMRIGGHFGLSYGCCIPLLIYFLIKYSLKPSRKIYIAVLIYNFLLFFIHPYMGMGLCLLTLLYLALFKLVAKINWGKWLTATLLMGLMPIILFKVFMFITDKHVERSDFPFGADVYVSNVPCVFVSYFGGPFEHFMKQIIKVGNREWEGVAYVGFFANFLIVLVAILALVFFRKYRFNKIALVLFLCGIIMLLFSFGLHTQLLKSLNIEIVALNQFRSPGRFAWFFYYILPIFLIVSLNKLFTDLFNKNSLKWMIPIALLFLSFNLLEGHYYNRMMFGNAFKVKNVFNYNLLSDAEKKLINKVKEIKPQAILPMPFYHYGSEVIDRSGTDLCYISMLVAYHCNLPIIGAHLSRTSVPESVEEIGLLNKYINHKEIFKKFDGKPITLIQTPSDNYMLDEIDLMKHSKFINQFGDYKLFTITKEDLNFGEDKIDSTYKIFVVTGNTLDTLGLKFIKTENRKPFITSIGQDYERLYTVEKGQLPAGNYIISFHYYFKEFKFKYIECNFILAKDDGKNPTWESISSVRRTHIYSDKIVFEKEITIDPNSKYDFVLNGGGNYPYYIDNFLFRPSTVNVIMKINAKTTFINNHPFIIK